MYIPIVWLPVIFCNFFDLIINHLQKKTKKYVDKHYPNVVFLYSDLADTPR